MKKLLFFIALLGIFTAPMTQCKLEIKTESGNIVEVDENETAAEFFQKCRESKNCTNKEELFLEFYNNRVQENSKLASVPLKEFRRNNNLRPSYDIDALIRPTDIYSIDAFVRPKNYDSLHHKTLLIIGMMLGATTGYLFKYLSK